MVRCCWKVEREGQGRQQDREARTRLCWEEHQASEQKWDLSEPVRAARGCVVTLTQWVGQLESHQEVSTGCQCSLLGTVLAELVRSSEFSPYHCMKCCLVMVLTHYNPSTQWVEEGIEIQGHFLALL